MAFQNSDLGYYGPLGFNSTLFSPEPEFNIDMSPYGSQNEPFGSDDSFWSQMDHNFGGPSLSHQSSMSSMNSMYSSFSTTSKRGARISSGYQCSKCYLAFNVPSELKHHERKHIPKADWPFACGDCNERFLYPKDLKRHRMRKHPGIERGSSGPGYHTPFDDLIHELSNKSKPAKVNAIPDTSFPSPGPSGGQKDDRTQQLETALNRCKEEIAILQQNQLSTGYATRMLRFKIYLLEQMLLKNGVNVQVAMQEVLASLPHLPLPEIESFAPSALLDSQVHAVNFVTSRSTKERAKGWLSSLRKLVMRSKVSIGKDDTIFRTLEETIESTDTGSRVDVVDQEEAQAALQTAFTYFAQPSTGGLCLSEMVILRHLLSRLKNVEMNLSI